MIGRTTQACASERVGPLASINSVETEDLPINTADFWPLGRRQQQVAGVKNECRLALLMHVCLAISDEGRQDDGGG